MKRRERNMVLRGNGEGLAVAHAVSDAQEEPSAFIVRRFNRDAYGARFGAKKLRKPTPKNGGAR